MYIYMYSKLRVYVDVFDKYSLRYLGPVALGLWGVHIWQTTCAHVTSNAMIQHT